jgi:dephospho-CoA kinase
MRRVGLTGGIGAGKSTVGRMFVDLGCHLLDADAIVHDLFLPGEAVQRAVADAFGPRVIAVDGSINRQVLGEIVFHDSTARERLNALVHPAVIQRQKDWLDSLESHDPDAIGIVEAALMIEAGTYKNYDKVVVVVCSPEEQRRRLKERSGLSDAQIESRIASQMPMEEKSKYADFLIDTSGSPEETRRQVADVYRKIQ